MRSLLLIADDFGLNEAVDAGILQLAQAKRLSGISCLTQLERWPVAARALGSLSPVQIGLHLNFSQAFGKGWHAPLPELIVRAYLRALPVGRIRESLNVQWGRFTEAMGRAPDFVDGHQHVHQLPVIREAMLALIDREGATPWLRVTHPLLAPDGGLKSQLIRHLGARSLRLQAAAQGLRLPPAFAGVYDFSGDEARYAERFARWVQALPNQAVVMCHPGRAAPPSVEDPIAAARPHEWAFFSSPRFDAVMTEAQCQLAFDLAPGLAPTEVAR
ncbi:ChbG/HpnK family deacetylase [Halothiobacillus sp. DCM-1]|uniref:ChbG/HpnK family deacetylase n=1 Tax=Halothiobacillus sp. DCM-1 TaxID=3112558 RepID=UPI00324E2A30